MNEMYAQYNADISKGDVSLLKDVHVYSSGLKSYCTKLGADGIEEARRCLGGHGYSMFSGMIDFHRQFLATVTYEGENALLTVSMDPCRVKSTCHQSFAFKSSDGASFLVLITFFLFFSGLTATSVALSAQVVQGCCPRPWNAPLSSIQVHCLACRPQLVQEPALCGSDNPRYVQR